MANRRSPWFTLCLALAVFSLAGHLIADATCRSVEANGSTPCDSAKPGNPMRVGELTINPLHTGVATPSALGLATPCALVLPLVNLGFNERSRFVSPPVQPPKPISIA